MQTVILLSVLAILIMVLVEMIESRKRNEADAKLRKQAVARLFAENRALEDKAQAMVSNYGY
jgi:response regulator RpfG family c-di-GMP phosphodiesterase